MITEEDALNALRRLSDPEAWHKESPLGGLDQIGRWAHHARQALSPERHDIQTAKACLAVISRLLGEPV
jgi:hypothetical protein